MFAEVILPLPLPGIFTYRIPDGCEVQPGMRVLVPLGRRLTYKGMVMRIYEKKPDIKGIRDIQSVLDTYPLVDEHQIKFWNWLADYYMCTPGEVYRTAMPRGLKESYSPKYQTFTMISEKFRKEKSLNGIMDELGRAPKQLLILQRLVEMLFEEGGPESGLVRGIPKSVLSQGMDFSASAYQGLLRKKILTEYSERTLRMPGEGRIAAAAKTLTNHQKSGLQ